MRRTFSSLLGASPQNAVPLPSAVPAPIQSMLTPSPTSPAATPSVSTALPQIGQTLPDFSPVTRPEFGTIGNLVYQGGAAAPPPGVVPGAGLISDAFTEAARRTRLALQLQSNLFGGPDT